MPDRPQNLGPPPAPPTLGSAELRDAERSLAAEWVEPDGCGGFAMASVLGCPTRRQHGLIVLRPTGLERRHVLLTSLGETLDCGGSAGIALDTTLRDGRFDRTGHLALDRFELEPLPTWTFVSGDVSICRELLRHAGTLLIRWTLLEGPARARLRLTPRLGPREADQLTSRNEALDSTLDVTPDGLRVEPYPGLPALHFTVGGRLLAMRVAPAWEVGHGLPVDGARGYQGDDDLWTPGELSLELLRGQPVVLAVGVDAPVEDPLATFDLRLEERTAAVRPVVDPCLARLERASRRFLYRDGSRPEAPRRGVVAGFPWLAEWGRDTFLALPGLTLAFDDLNGCRDVLLGAVDRIEGGLVPTHFGADPDSDHFAGADTSLWFARAVRLYERAGGDRATITSRLMPALTAIADRYLEGTDLGIHTDAQGLLHVGSPTLAATWMDARTDGQPCTSRYGHPVEIQALWLALLAHLEARWYECGRRGEAERYSDVQRRASTAFVERFCASGDDALVDVWRPDDADRSLRPNMVIAAAVEQSPLSNAQRRRIVERAERELLTPRGLRSLGPDDAGYEGRCSGSPGQRDRRRHQGSAWPWLLGFLVEARLRAFGPERTGLDRLEGVLRELEAELERDCLGAIGELYDGDLPHRAAETPAMAKSVAEVARGLRLIRDARSGSLRLGGG